MNIGNIANYSSFLFIISAIKAYYCGNNIAWKLSNGVLIIASYLCNSTGYEPVYLLLDYFTISVVCMSYINNIYTHGSIGYLMLYEFQYTGSIEHTKNIAFVTAIAKSIKNTYYVSRFHWYVLVGSSIASGLVYKIRYELYKQKHREYNVLLTYLLHICITTIIYICSMTA